jgi:hypothetical protein
MQEERKVLFSLVTKYLILSYCIAQQHYAALNQKLKFLCKHQMLGRLILRDCGKKWSWPVAKYFSEICNFRNFPNSGLLVPDVLSSSIVPSNVVLNFFSSRGVSIQ